MFRCGNIVKTTKLKKKAMFDVW